MPVLVNNTRTTRVTLPDNDQLFVSDLGQVIVNAGPAVASAATGQRVSALVEGTVFAFAGEGLSLGTGGFHNVRIGKDGLVGTLDDSTAVALRGARSTLSNDGDVVGGVGVSLTDGLHMRMVNAGHIEGLNGAGLYLEEAALPQIRNTGSIVGESGIEIGSNASPRIVNDGDITGFDYTGGGIGINLTGVTARSVTVINNGTITGRDASISLGVGGDTVVNRWHLDGAVALGGGDDRFDSRGGTIDGWVSLGGGNDRAFGSAEDDTIYGGDGDDRIVGMAGDDVLWGDAGNDMLSGQAGDDDLRGGAGNDDLLGGAGDDWLSGNDGIDTLRGGEGADTLSGGAGADRFVFRPGEGHDVVLDFQNGFDKLDIRGFGFSNWSQVYAASKSVPGATYIQLDDDVSVTLQGFSRSLFTADDVII